MSLRRQFGLLSSKAATCLWGSVRPWQVGVVVFSFLFFFLLFFLFIIFSFSFLFLFLFYS
jgi:hypothetical protein